MKIFQIKALALLLLLTLIMATISCEQSEVLPNPTENSGEIVERVPCFPPSFADINMTQTASKVQVNVPTPHGQKTHQFCYKPTGPGTAWVCSGATSNSFSFNKNQCANAHRVRVRRKCSEFTWSSWSSVKTLVNNGPLCE